MSPSALNVPLSTASLQICGDAGQLHIGIPFIVKHHQHCRNNAARTKTKFIFLHCSSVLRRDRSYYIVPFLHESPLVTVLQT